MLWFLSQNESSLPFLHHCYSFIMIHMQEKVFQNSYSFLCSLKSQEQKYVDELHDDYKKCMMTAKNRRYIAENRRFSVITLLSGAKSEQVSANIFVNQGASAKQNFL